MFPDKLIKLLQNLGRHVVSNCLAPFNLICFLYYDTELKKWSSQYPEEYLPSEFLKASLCHLLAPPSLIEMICKLLWVQRNLFLLEHIRSIGSIEIHLKTYNLLAPKVEILKIASALEWWQFDCPRHLPAATRKSSVWLYRLSKWMSSSPSTICLVVSILISNPLPEMII